MDEQRVPPPFTPTQQLVFMSCAWLVAALLTAVLYPVAYWVGCRTSGDALADSAVAGMGLAWGGAFQVYVAYAVRCWRETELVSETNMEIAEKLWRVLPIIWLGPTVALFLVLPWLWRLTDGAFGWLSAHYPT